MTDICEAWTRAGPSSPGAASEASAGKAHRASATSSASAIALLLAGQIGCGPRAKRRRLIGRCRSPVIHSAAGTTTKRHILSRGCAGVVACRDRISRQIRALRLAVSPTLMHHERAIDSQPAAGVTRFRRSVAEGQGRLQRKSVPRARQRLWSPPAGEGSAHPGID